MAKRVWGVLLGLMFVMTLVISFLAPAYAESKSFNVTLGPFFEDVTVTSGTKSYGSGAALICVYSTSPNGGHFWITKDGSQCSTSVTVGVGQTKGSSYNSSSSSGTVVLHAHQIYWGGGTDTCKGYVNFNN